jgi:hypothetical protein
MIALIDANAAFLTTGAKSGCKILKQIRREDLPREMQNELQEGLKTCATP